MKIKNNIMNNTNIGNVEKEASDINKDGKVNSQDYMLIKKHIMEGISFEI
jgi:HD-GYP domain-containing protein (c-di-GMP phosphodiesterase class II)